MPSVQRVHDELREHDVVMLAISIDAGPAPVESYLEENSYTMPVVLDATADVARSFGVIGTPTTFVINREGDLVASGFGPFDFDHPEFRNYLRNLLAESI